MVSTEKIPDLDHAGLRRFGWITGGIIAVLFGLFFPWLFERGTPLWPWLLGGALAVWGVIAPAALRPIYHGWMRFGLLMNRVTSPIILGAIFFILLTPMAIVMKIIDRKRVPLTFDRSASSYWIESRPLSRKDLEKPF